jgi:hypothetical protein
VPSIDTKVDRTHGNADGHEQRFWKISVYKTIKKMWQKRPTVRLRSGLLFKELLGHKQRTGQWRQFHHDSPNQRKDVERGQQYTATGPERAENYPTVSKANGL